MLRSVFITIDIIFSCNSKMNNCKIKTNNWYVYLCIFKRYDDIIKIVLIFICILE